MIYAAVYRLRRSTHHGAIRKGDDTRVAHTTRGYAPLRGIHGRGLAITLRPL